jgi:hypothetical protein
MPQECIFSVAQDKMIGFPREVADYFLGDVVSAQTGHRRGAQRTSVKDR